MKIVYYGSSEFSIPILKSLIQSEFEVVLIITQPDKKKGRGQKFLPTEVKALGLTEGIEVWTPKTLRDEEFYEKYREVEHDIAIVASYGKIVPGNVLNVPKNGYVNVHSSLLPLYRGASPIHGALLDGKAKTGITIMKMDEGLDTGDMILTSETEITETDDVVSLSDRLAEMGGEEIVKALRLIKENRAAFVPQDNSKATFTKKITKQDGIINWNMPSQELMNKDKAYKGWPGLQTTFRGKDIVLEGLQQAQLTENVDEDFLKNAQCGTIVAKNKYEFCLKLVDGLIKVQYLKVSGKNRQDVKSFISGYQPKAGETFENN